ncbi:30S ribosomal protein S11 [Candidatus Shapirobacteria bacterium]|nr:30S ribosomal protein S11 [Candidatus Shapirobacteria bacterium]
MSTQIKKEKKSLEKKETRFFSGEGRVYISASFNNTLVTITDEKSRPLAWTSCGRLGFKGTRKSTPYAANSTLEAAIELIKKLGIKRVEVYIKGPGPGRDSALKILGAGREIDLLSISDVTPIPHNGPRPPKRRRV